MKVLITGGAGYIGSHTNRYFNKKGIETVIIDDLSNGHKEAVVVGKLVEGDFGDKVLINDLISSGDIDAIIHFAAFADVADSVANPAKYYENNVSKMLVLLDAAVAHNVKYFVFSSSAATFGEPQYLPIDEAHPQQPINPYGLTKLIGEKILEDYERAYGIKSCILRYFNAAGGSKDGMIGEAHDPEHHIIPLVLRSTADAASELEVFGNDYPTRDGSCLRDYIHVDDLADAHYRSLVYIMEHNVSEAFNLGSNNGFTVFEIINECEKVTGKKVKYKVAGRRPGDPASLIASNEKVKKLLGWEPQNEISAIIMDAWKWETNKLY
ncbi:MAG: UDP-glucose 4-epimerase GalE [Clostridia bacterium]|nr:UDP-glucose 4-epimerase GalE [Clostridia bacterium]